MRRAKSFLLVLCTLALVACDASKIPGWWATYQHPTYQFSFKHPRNWKVEEGGTFGSLINILPPEDDSLFRANANIVVEDQEENVTLKMLADRSRIQLSNLLQDYQLLASVTTKMGNIDAVELRGRYKASEGDRLIRTWIGYATKHVYVFTFICRADNESLHTKDLHALLRSMIIPTS